MNRRRSAVAVFIVAVLTGTSGVARSDTEPTIASLRAARPSALYPLRADPSRRYLVDQRGRPFMIVGDSPQALVVDLSLKDAQRFLANRQAAGFNSVWVNLLCDSFTGGRSDGTTYDGIAPFQTPGDLSTPNEAYFQRADAVIRIAARHGITVFLDPIETIGWLGVLLQNGTAKAYAYGRYLGERYRTFPNIVWFNGNDFYRWSDRDADAAALAVARGIRATDKVHIHTVELEPPTSGSLDDARWRPIIKLNAAYTYLATYAQVLKEYNRRNFLPTFMVEASYEFEHAYTGPETLRHQEYWTMLSGATGQFYGNKYTWQIIDGWESHLTTKGVTQLKYVTKLFSGGPWFKLVPDQNHTLVTAGYGTFDASGSVNDNDYVTAARTPDGKLAIAYLPVVRSVAVNLKKISGRVQAQWYDPTTGRFSVVPGSPFSNSRTRAFMPPGENHDGDGDWVLVLTAV